jgi:hypothetical protein
MSCEHLICAHCNGPVVEGRCPACREARARVHHHNTVKPQVLIALALVLVVMLLLAAHVVQ